MKRVGSWPFPVNKAKSFPHWQIAKTVQKLKWTLQIAEVQNWRHAGSRLSRLPFREMLKNDAGTCSWSNCISSPNISSFVGHGLMNGAVAPCCMTKMKWNEMKMKMKWDEMKMKWSEMKWNEVKWNERTSTKTWSSADSDFLGEEKKSVKKWRRQLEVYIYSDVPHTRPAAAGLFWKMHRESRVQALIWSSGFGQRNELKLVTKNRA